MCCRQMIVHKVLKLLARPALHAKTLGFVHPVTGAALKFNSELPEDFSAALGELRALDEGDDKRQFRPHF